MNRHLSTLALALFTSAIAFEAQAAEVKNIVIVHGALADGSGWRQATEILERRGYAVTIVQQPITSLADDVAATNRVLDLQHGPTLLVGHSYGGIVITEAGNRADVAGLVYVAAFQPDKGESLLALASSKPAGGMNIRETKDGKYLYLDPSRLRRRFRCGPSEGRSGIPCKISGLCRQGGVFGQGRRSGLANQEELVDRGDAGSRDQSRSRTRHGQAGRTAR